MATKSLLLSCLLMGTGIAQHPVSERSQTQDTLTFTVSADFEASTDPPFEPLPIEWDCVPFTPEDIAKNNEFSRRVDKIPEPDWWDCLAVPSGKKPICEPVHEWRDFLREKCPGFPANGLSNIRGIAQHPASEGIQAHNTPAITISAGFATSTPPWLPVEWACDFSQDDVAKAKELFSRVWQMPWVHQLKCSPPPGSDQLPGYPECEPLQEFLDFVEPKCPKIPQVGALFNALEDIPASTHPAGPAINTDPPVCKPRSEDLAKLKEIVSRVNQIPEQDVAKCIPTPGSGHIPDVPDYPECEPVQELMDWLEGNCPELASDVLSNIPRDVKDDNDMSCLSRFAVDWSESRRRHNEADICVSTPVQRVSLEQRDADEPYHPALKPIYGDCDVLEDPEMHTMCVLSELERALCEQEPWIAYCQDLESSRADWFSSKSATIDNDLLDKIFDTDDAVPVADDDELPRHPQVSAASRATQFARLIEELPLSSLEELFQECERDVGCVPGEHCLSEKIKDKVCTNNPGIEICEVPRAALINERDFPLYTKTADISN